MKKVKIQPIGDRVLVKAHEVAEQVKGGILIPDSAKEKPQEAVVIAVGPGSETKMQVKEGDKVIYSEYSGTEVKLGDEEYIVVSQKDIIAVVE